MAALKKRISIPKRDKIAPEVLKELDKYPQINIYTVLAHTPSCCKPWMDLIKGIYDSGLSPRLREIGICRLGYLTKSEYESHQHHFIGLKNGLTEEEIHIITSENPVVSLDEEGNFICKVVDELERKSTVSDATFDELTRRYSESVIVAMSVAFATYGAVGRITNMLRLEIEESNPLKNYGSFAKK